MGNALVFISVVTDLHNGAGQGLGQVDRPIVRERKTGFPFIQSETLKGNFRAEFAARAVASGPKLSVICGDDSSQGSKHRGFLELTDAQILAMPVRSLRGGFVWITTPLLLARLERFWRLVDASWAAASSVLALPVTPGTITVGTAAKAEIAHKGQVFLEDVAFRVEEAHAIDVFTKDIAQTIWRKGGWWANRFQKTFGLLAADDFAHFVRHATEVRANIQIHSTGEQAGTTKSGSLRYTEYLPQETLLYSLVEAESVPPELAAHLTDATGNIEQPIELLAKLLETPGLFQIGGDETKGKGLVSLTLKASVETGNPNA